MKVMDFSLLLFVRTTDRRTNAKRRSNPTPVDHQDQLIDCFDACTWDRFGLNWVWFEHYLGYVSLTSSTVKGSLCFNWKLNHYFYLQIINLPTTISNTSGVIGFHRLKFINFLKDVKNCQTNRINTWTLALIKKHFPSTEYPKLNKKFC